MLNFLRAMFLHWASEKKIKADKNMSGVQLRSTRRFGQETDYNLRMLIINDVITFDDLDGFSDEMISTSQEMVIVFGDHTPAERPFFCVLYGKHLPAFKQKVIVRLLP